LPLRTTRCSSYSRRWYADGDSIAIPTLELRGVVEDVSLRRTKLRTLDGEKIQVVLIAILAYRYRGRFFR